MNLRSQAKRLQRFPKAKKSRSVSVESCYISIPDRKTQRITEHPIDKVKNCKPIKLKARLREWLESKRLSKRVPEYKRREVSCYQTTIGTKHEYMGCPLTDCVSPNPDKPDSDRPPDYADHNIPDHVLLDLEVKIYAVDPIAHSQHEVCGEPSPQITENCPHSIVHHVELAQSPTNSDERTEPDPDARALEDDFHNFYYSLRPFIYLRSDPGAQIPAATDPNTVDPWGNLFSDIAPTAPDKVFSAVMEVNMVAWEIDQLHKDTSLNPKSTPNTERSEAARGSILKFDEDFQNSDTAAPNPEWQRLKFDDIRGDGEPPFGSSTGITKHTDNSTESGRSCEAIQNSQGSGPMNQKLLPKRGRYEDDSNGGKKRKKEDQSPKNRSGPSPIEIETFACPFKGRKHTGVNVVKACDTDFPNLSKVKEHLRRAHFFHLQCPRGGCEFRAGSKYEINRHQKRTHPPLQHLPLAIEQTTNMEHLQKHKALMLRTLTWEEISQICFSMEHTLGFLRGVCGGNGGGNGDEIEDDGDDGVSSPASRSETQETNGNTPVTDLENEYVPVKYSPGPSAGDAHSTNLFGGEAFRNNTETGESSQIPPNNTPGEAKFQDHTPNEHHRDFLLQIARSDIYAHFEGMRCEFTPRIISYLRTHSLDETDINGEIRAIFKRLYQLIENHSMADIFAASNTQTNLPGGPDGKPRFVPPSSTTQQSSSSNTMNSPWNRNYNYNPGQTYMGHDLGTDTPVYYGQGDKATVQIHPQSPDWVADELLATLSMRPHGTFPTGEYAWTQNPCITRENTYVPDTI